MEQGNIRSSQGQLSLEDACSEILVGACFPIVKLEEDGIECQHELAKPYSNFEKAVTDVLGCKSRLSKGGTALRDEMDKGFEALLPEAKNICDRGMTLDLSNFSSVEKCRARLSSIKDLEDSLLPHRESLDALALKKEEMSAPSGGKEKAISKAAARYLGKIEKALECGEQFFKAASDRFSEVRSALERIEARIIERLEIQKTVRITHDSPGYFSAWVSIPAPDGLIHNDEATLGGHSRELTSDTDAKSGNPRLQKNKKRGESEEKKELSASKTKSGKKPASSISEKSENEEGPSLDEQIPDSAPAIGGKSAKPRSEQQKKKADSEETKKLSPTKTKSNKKGVASTADTAENKEGLSTDDASKTEGNSPSPVDPNLIDEFKKYDRESSTGLMAKRLNQWRDFSRELREDIASIRARLRELEQPSVKPPFFSLQFRPFTMVKEFFEKRGLQRALVSQEVKLREVGQSRASFSQAKLDNVRAKFEGKSFEVTRGNPQGIPAQIFKASIPFSKKDTLFSFERLCDQIVESARPAVIIDPSRRRIDIVSATKALTFHFRSDSKVSVFVDRGDKGGVERIGSLWNDDALTLATQFLKSDEIMLKRNPFETKRLIPARDYLR